MLVGVFLSCFLFVNIGNGSKLSRFKRQQVESTTETQIDDDIIIEIFNNCKCVFQYLCDENNFIITGGQTLINERFDAPPRKLCKGDYPGQRLCCKYRNATMKETIIPPTTTTIITKPRVRKCGTQLPVINVRIFAGEDELTPVIGEFPWLTVIYRKNENNEYEFQCTGSLIHPKVVLTANHCIRRFQDSDLRILLNSDITLIPVGKNPTLERNVSEIIRHENFNSGSLYNDIALLILNEPYNINDTSLPLNTICLDANKSLENLRCVVAGWGKKPANEEGDIRLLKKVELPLVEHGKCQSLLRRTRLSEFFELDKSFMCAGGEEGKDTCKGDGGSPLMCPTDTGNSMFQVGIVSWGIGCATKDVPGVYTDVSQFKTWINDHLLQRNIK